MATVRFFAQAKDAAGCARTEVDAVTVGEALATVTERFGPRFAEVLAISAVWLNGEFAAADEAVGDGDEVAILPPVSGG